MTRFVHLDRPLAYPFFDIITRDTNTGGCFDLSVLLEDYTGSLYIRDGHIIEMARALGMETRDEVASMKAYIAELEARIDRLPAAQEELKDGLSALVIKFRSDLLADSISVPVPVEKPEPELDFLDEAERESKQAFSL